MSKSKNSSAAGVYSDSSLNIVKRLLESVTLSEATKPIGIMKKL